MLHKQSDDDSADDDNAMKTLTNDTVNEDGSIYLAYLNSATGGASPVGIKEKANSMT